MTLSISELDKDIRIMMDVARTVSRYSSATRARVGAVLFNRKTRNVVSFGYNGMPAGESNICEEGGKTKEDVIHAEINALRKVSWWKRRTSILGVTHAPCISCARGIIRAGIKEVYYLEPYGDMRGVGLLKSDGIKVMRVLWM